MSRYDAQQYYQAPKTQKQYVESRLVDLITKTPERVLEIGPGDGHLIHSLKSVEKVVLEKSLEMIELVPEGIEIIHGDIADSTISDLLREPFDLIIANYVFMELSSKELEIAFSNIALILKLDGTFVFSITDPEALRRRELDNVQISFPKDFSFSKDQEYEVLFKDSSGKYVDVGVIDYFNPVEVYEDSLSLAGFVFSREYVERPGDGYSIGVIYRCHKASA